MTGNFRGFVDIVGQTIVVEGSSREGGSVVVREGSRAASLYLGPSQPPSFFLCPQNPHLKTPPGWEAQ